MSIDVQDLYYIGLDTVQYTIYWTGFLTKAISVNENVKYNIFQYFTNSYLFHTSFQCIQLDIYSRTDHYRDNSDHHFCKDLKNKLKYMQRHTILAMLKLQSKSKVTSKKLKKQVFFQIYLFRIYTIYKFYNNMLIKTTNTIITIMTVFAS